MVAGEDFRSRQNAVGDGIGRLFRVFSVFDVSIARFSTEAVLRHSAEPCKIKGTVGIDTVASAGFLRFYIFRLLFGQSLLKINKISL